jgi:predicted nucleotidyltransferase
MNTALLDPATEHAAQVFLERIFGRYRVVGAILFGSRARHTQRADSDADLAVLLPAPHGERIDVAIDMAGVAFDVLLDTGILIPDAAIRLNCVTAKLIGGKSDENHND